MLWALSCAHISFVIDFFLDIRGNICKIRICARFACFLFPRSFLPYPLLVHFTMPNLFKKASTRGPLHAPPVPNLLPVGGIPSARWPYASLGLFLGVQGQVATPSSVFSQVMPQGQALHEAGDEAAGEMVMFEESEDELSTEDDDKEEAARQIGKKEWQWRKWSEDVIPALLEPYLELLRESESLRDVSGARNAEGCKGCRDKRQLEVVCVYFESK